MADDPDRARRALAAGVLLACASCAAFDRGSAPAPLVALPCDVAAAVTAGALAKALGASPADGGVAPIGARADGSFAVRFARDRHDRWSADTDGRIAVRVDCGGRARIELRAPRRSIALAPGSRDVVSLRLEPRDDGTALRLDGPAALLPELWARLERAVQLAVDHQLASPELSEPNLSAWRLAQLVGAARERVVDDPQTAAELLRRATRLPQAPACVHAELAELEAGVGDQQRAIAGYRLAALLTRDPQQRAGWSHAQRVLQAGRDEPAQLRSTALEHLLHGQVAVAETLLHSARRAERTPAIDYALLSRLHRVGGDELAALAADLLARESGATDTAPTLAWQQHLSRATAAAMPAAPAR